ncbi:MAG: hypothetical protein NW220_15060 [Leptolyngbyaceae cyanobacterium bins.349]|nr:hypothetical protein [Leptolyngbyaceae cyanobacterium bins.349]
MATPRLTLHLGEGSVSFLFPLESAKELQAALVGLLNALKASVAQAGTPAKAAPQPPLEYLHTGDVFLEIFCNPNIWPTPFAAKVLVTLKSDRISLTTEAELSRLIEDVNQYLDQ